MSYLVLHIDVDFIVGTICADNGTSSPIINGQEELLWLYFFNNPHQNSISYGKDNKTHFNNSEVNYYGKFFEKIEIQQETFILRGIEHPVIDLLKESGLLENIRETYYQKTLDNTENISTLLTFSSSISDNAKQKTVDYLKNNAFEIKSYTIPLAELVSYHALSNKKVKAVNGGVAIFLEATNPTLHLMKLSLSDNYFLLDGKPQIREGMGYDPRKLALLRYVVNEANKSIGALFTENEKLEECKRFEMQADEWLKKLDSTSHNMPYNVRSISFSKMPNSKKDVLIRKSDLDSDTGAYTQGLKDVFDAFRTDNLCGDVMAVFLLGNCFQNDRVKTSFQQMLGTDKLYFYANKDIQDIMTMYPKIDITRYAIEESRIKERSKAEELKQAEQRAYEDKQRKEKEAAAEIAAVEQKAHENRKEAKILFERAVELQKAGKLEDARVNVENAINLDNTNKEYILFIDDLKDKIQKLIDKTELYKKYLNKAGVLLKNGELEKAIDEYEAAKFVFDNAEIIAKIIEVKRLIKDKEKQKLKIAQLLSNVKVLIQQKDFQNAKSKINEIYSIDKTSADASKFLSEIDEINKKQEKQFNNFVKSADKYYDSANFPEAISQYKQALTIKSEDTYCFQQIENIEETIQQQKVNQEKSKNIIAKADELFRGARLQEALVQYQLALNLCPQDKLLQGNISECNAKIKEVEDKFTDLLMSATISEKKGKLKDALEALEDAKRIRPDNEDIKRRIKNMKFALEFDNGKCIRDAPYKPQKIKTKNDHDYPVNGLLKNSVNEDDFLGIKKNNLTSNIKNDEDDFFIEKPKKTIDDNDDFLGTKRKI